MWCLFFAKATNETMSSACAGFVIYTAVTVVIIAACIVSDSKK